MAISWESSRTMVKKRHAKGQITSKAFQPSDLSLRAILKNAREHSRNPKQEVLKGNELFH